jgi:hypothetical protein
LAFLNISVEINLSILIGNRNLSSWPEIMLYLPTPTFNMTNILGYTGYM